MKVGRSLANFAFPGAPRRIRIRLGPGESRTPRAHRPKVGDYDNDGDADIVVVNKNDRPAVLRNDGGNGGSWLVIRPQGVESNRGGIGAKVYVEAGGTCRYFEFEVRGSDGYLPGNDLRIHAGLGTEEAADVEIHWHSGRRDFFRAVVVRRFYLATEGRGTRVDSPAAAARRP
ncbi:MAG: CRTAC1 family protein [Bryobacterales bacterium]|nr:CRTAC1 family protein [Bryobacterales bacterium]